MSFDSLLINTCTVKRLNETGEDAYGNPTGSWDDHLTDQDCRLMITNGREVVIGAEVVVADYKLFIGDVDITERDRVVIGSDTYEVLLVAPRQDGSSEHHLECYLRTVR
jgi:hypothetical protein